VSVTSDIDLIWLQKRAELCGCYCNRHPDADPMSGDLYLMDRRTVKHPHPPSYVKYATIGEVENALAKIEGEGLRRKRA
jgi:hypothetical protein